MTSPPVTRAAIAVLAMSRLAFAECPEGQTPASCALHDEGVAAFTAGKYAEAATKFRAAIAAGPTARSYLGYSQSVEGQGKLALAYETMLVAQKLSNEELARAPNDTAIVGRAERIKYKLAELGQKIAYVWLRLPDGVPPSRVVAVYREGEGDLASPIGRWIVVAPNKQNMFVSLDDGTRIPITATIAPGSKGTIAIPVPAVATAQPVPIAPQQPAFVQPTLPGQDPYMPAAPPKPAPSPPNTVFSVDAAFVFRDAEAIGAGVGFGVQFERKLAARLALIARAAIVIHPSRETEISPVETASVSATEWLATVGARTRSKLPLYASVELGALVLGGESTVSITGTPDRTEEFSQTYPALLVGGGVRLGRVHFEAYALAVGNTGDFDLPVRFFATFGVDLVRR